MIMTTILITGSEGNIGSFLVKKMIELYPDSRFIRVTREKKNSSKREADVVLVGDLNDQNFIHEIFKKYAIDYLMHAAAYPYSQNGFRYPYDILKNDVTCLNNVLNNSKTIKKVIYLSSILVYESSSVVPYTEELTEEIPPPKSPYGIAKYFCEKAITSFTAQTNIPHTIWRLHNIISPLEKYNEGGSHVYMDFYQKIFIEKSPTLQMFGNGRQIRCFTWVEDAAEGISKHFFDERTDNQVFNMGSEEEISLVELKDEMFRLGKKMGLLKIEYNPPLIITESGFSGVDSLRRVSSVEKLKRTLGWSCKTNLSTCLTKFIKMVAGNNVFKT